MTKKKKKKKITRVFYYFRVICHFYLLASEIPVTICEPLNLSPFMGFILSNSKLKVSKRYLFSFQKKQKTKKTKKKLFMPWNLKATGQWEVILHCLYRVPGIIGSRWVFLLIPPLAMLFCEQCWIFTCYYPHDT